MTAPDHTRHRPVLLSTYPTPLQPASRLATAIGLRPEDLWIKRDDLTGLAGGGNKIRKLEWTVGAALADGADTLVTTGAAQSNHARLTAAAGARLGLDVVLVFPGTPSPSWTGNLVLDSFLGASIFWAGEVDADGLADAAHSVADRLRRAGARTAFIPFGGSSSLGARGYLQCARELRAQASDIRHTVVALGSGGTMAGLVAGFGAEAVLGVDTGARSGAAEAVQDFAGPLMSRPLEAADLRVRDDQIGAGYATYTDEAAAALSVTARTEGIILDPIYTGRAMAGLIAAVRDGDIRPGEKTVFLHTGGLPGLFGNADAQAHAARIAKSLD
ncbi:D-cysteine desulfhydrase family protein [Streptomyces sp. NPDC089424]|uniref:D-cysteine desulfhydrase family protein n=1 Tax=Streptomyces sp. NPDC089424 TaxID=3365917 RepID=UPI0038040A73